MKFCRNCGRTIALLQDSSTEYCEKCASAAQDNTLSSSQAVEADRNILSAFLSVKNGKIVLESEEGWLLWSGSDSVPHSLPAILERATHIFNIRKRAAK
ncbi:MAG: hypothetical protein V2I36_17675 [Desulfopila sp.]|jgi:hypothetical protein|nr:hypothetical protein [Desulfopila sp.]